MKIIVDNKGQTCNKFWGYLAPLKEAIQNNSKFYIIFPDANLKDFPNLLHNKYIITPLPYKIASIFLSYKIIERIMRRIITYKCLKKFSKFTWFSWNDRRLDIDNVLYNIIRHFFLPSSSIISNVDNRFASERLDSDVIIGVHVRRGDYEKWLDGKYYFSIENYKEICNKILKDFVGLRCKFFIASNEDISEFENLSSFSISGSAASDLYALSKCDYIIGPPSSFSRWASFFGRVPIRFILSASQLTESFRIMSSYSMYSNGDKLEFDV